MKEMKRHIRVFVKSELFKHQQIPPATNRRFHPKASDIRNHMYQATVKLRLSKIDQENVTSSLEKWRKENPEDNFFFRPYELNPNGNDEWLNGEESDENEKEDLDITISEQSSLKHSLLFVHQTAWQRRLLARFGNNLCLLDATYKTTQYALPLFFLAVKTNVDYQVVGCFVTQQETVAAIAEPLKILKQWAPDWTPSYFMTDNCEQEIRALEDTFPGILNINYISIVSTSFLQEVYCAISDDSYCCCR